MDDHHDELMGPRPGQDLRQSVFQGEPKATPDTARRTASKSSGPPPTLFHSMPDRWAQDAVEDHNEAQARQTTSRKAPSIMGFDEEDSVPVESSDSRIRQDALRMLEVADSGNYSVHRTVSGGFMASPRAMGDKKRVPTALAGLGTFVKTARASKPRTVTPAVYRDEPTNEDYEYGEGIDDARFAASQAKEDTGSSTSNWSSRYSVDDTLMAMAGGATKKSNTSFLDKLDNQNKERRSARNMFMGSPAKDTKVFGTGFSFRQNSVFGKQGVTASENLRTVWMDAGASNSPARSWQDQLKDTRQQRRKYMITAAFFCAFCVTFVAVLSRHRSNLSSSAAKTGPNGEEAITFYVTSDVPSTVEEEDLLANELTTLSTRADFLVHLGNIQDSEVTMCGPDQYAKVADILWESPVPVFVVPGEEDWANCPSQEDAWYYWVDNFLEFDTYFDKDFPMMRQENYLENFAFVDRGVLFIGIHETNGRIDDWQELQARNLANVEWIEGMTNQYSDDIRALVIFANGRPLLETNNLFYEGLSNVLFKLNWLPIAYIHANDYNGGEELTYKPYDIDGMEHVIAIQTSSGETHEPLRIHIGWDETNPFIVG